MTPIDFLNLPPDARATWYHAANGDEIHALQCALYQHERSNGRHPEPIPGVLAEAGRASHAMLLAECDAAASAARDRVSQAHHDRKRRTPTGPASIDVDTLDSKVKAIEAKLDNGAPK